MGGTIGTNSTTVAVSLLTEVLSSRILVKILKDVCLRHSPKPLSQPSVRNREVLFLGGSLILRRGNFNLIITCFKNVFLFFIYIY